MHKTFHKSDHSHPSAVQYLDAIPHLPTIDERHIAWIKYQAVRLREERVVSEKMASHDAQGSLVARIMGCRFVCAVGQGRSESRSVQGSLGCRGTARP